MTCQILHLNADYAVKTLVFNIIICFCIIIFLRQILHNRFIYKLIVVYYSLFLKILLKNGYYINVISVLNNFYLFGILRAFFNIWAYFLHLLALRYIIFWQIYAFVRDLFVSFMEKQPIFPLIHLDILRYSPIFNGFWLKSFMLHKNVKWLKFRRNSSRAPLPEYLFTTMPSDTERMRSVSRLWTNQWL